MKTEKPRYRLLEPARNNGLFQEVADRLRDAILQGRFRPGERLREVELSNLLEVSRGPVREALTKLEHEGLVITRRNRGATVARLSAEDEEEVRSLRLAIERLAVTLVVRQARPDDLDALQREIERLGSGTQCRIVDGPVLPGELPVLLRHPAHPRLSALPAVAAGLANGDVFMIKVTNLADGCIAFMMHQPHFP